MDIFSILSSNSIRLKELFLIRDEILLHSQYFESVYAVVFNLNNKHAWRFAWALEKVCEKDASLFSENHVLRLMDFFVQIGSQNTASSSINSLKRSILSILINLPIPKNLPVEFINICFEKMILMKEPVAVQSLCMKMLLRISDKESDFIPEIIATLENIDLSGATAGYIAMRKQVLATLYKKIKS